MIYRSNVECPNLQHKFPHAVCRPMSHSIGHSVLSDFGDYPANHSVFGLYKKCGFMTHDEAAIVYHIAQEMPGKRWLEIGSHTGWVMAHLLAAGCFVLGLDPMYRVPEFLDRAKSNLGDGDYDLSFLRSDEYFACQPTVCFNGIIIDGDHDMPHPLRDAQNAEKNIAEDGVIIFHDYWGGPVQRGVEYLVDRGWRKTVYHTPHGLAVCDRGVNGRIHHTPDKEVLRMTASA